MNDQQTSEMVHYVAMTLLIHGLADLLGDKPIPEREVFADRLAQAGVAAMFEFTKGNGVT